jgi:hypothetical protein
MAADPIDRRALFNLLGRNARHSVKAAREMARPAGDRVYRGMVAQARKNGWFRKILDGLAGKRK